MSDLAKRFENLTPEQQKLLKLRLKKKGIQAPDDKSSDSGAAPGSTRQVPSGKKLKMNFGLYFFSADGTAKDTGKYQLLIDSAKYADQNGFTAVWTPERHFQAFGGLYPNPSVLSAALAMITENVQIRAGSCALPLHSPVRVAEEWGLVDNLSNGRAAISFATGWHQDDFVIRPENYHDRREIMFREIETVRKLWRGETVTIKGVDGRESQISTLPRPIQPELQYWVTCSSPPTWQRAGEIGANVLCAFAGTIDDLAGFVQTYRQARVQNGHDPRKGIVSLMLHTYIHPDIKVVKDRTREPMKHYLSNYLNQFNNLMEAETGQKAEDKDGVLEFAFERYYSSSSLLGDPEKCGRMIDDLAMAGVDEATCLIDFGVEHDDVLESLKLLNELRLKYAK